MRIAYSYLVLAAVAGMASMVSAAGINPTQGDMSDGASDWGLVNGTTVSSAAQSPFTNAFPDNGAGLVLPAGLAFFTPAFDRSFTPQSGTALINIDLLIVGSSTEHHFLEIKGDTGNPIRLAIGTGFGAPIVLWDGASGSIHPDNAAAAANKWYNINLAIDFTLDTVVAYVTPFGGRYCYY